ncbi:MAG: MBOAT family protein [Lachnospiraceae bacterium]|nr:MBOAT family protein [Lachnospiraceae bacterium]
MAYAIFLPVVFLLYWICPHRFRWIPLLAVSFWFCANLDVRYAVVLLAVTVVSYAAGRMIEGAKDRGGKRRALLPGILLLVGCLAFFKYANFIIANVNALTALWGKGTSLASLKLILPVGISFYTFQTIGYLADVYRGKIPAERHFGYYALFTSFFPELISGPIGRAGDLLPQYRKPRELSADDLTYGLKLMAWGYFKKLCIADAIAPVVNNVYAKPMSYAGLIYIVVPVLYSIEIYCDFSGYTDIAVGTARLFGIDLIQNFKNPYGAHSVREFWSRWHISLSTWLRDYIYIPMGGSRCSRLRQCFNIMVTFLVSGLWHGASWTFVIWGGLHGFFQVVESLFRPSWKEKQRLEKRAQVREQTRKAEGLQPAAAEPGKKLPALVRGLQIVWTFALVTLAWMFFRTDSLSTLQRFFEGASIGVSDPYNYLKTLVICMDMQNKELIWMAIPIAILWIVDALTGDGDIAKASARWKPWVKYPIYVLFLVALLLFSQKGVSTNFIYAAF